ncbi:1,4-alpha-glucan branching protein GlgB [Streptomyces cocklensis]|uniref:1,4-alpha-glucan branching enzyme GlgB n=1 Tax=Actinacidiphila cocklensis TaxID=887465 RepID=A0A9W4GRF4_9ACTN|nr:1,4-alpha-glucan branching protein GlgB [Actinacidiphila cocklensis]MDD1060757.1 1,4-alpha-glucan branching protein GlgB [Actinacidiphila cocklensis]CAG6394624.1 1,4-alpha-glucan branching enzyme GlgB [Actinacidiphila cocklensis]
MAAPTRRSTVRRTGRAAPLTLSPARPAPPLPAHEAEALVEGRHHDPHAVLGAHPVPGGVCIRVLRPHAQRVVAVVDGEGYELTAQNEGFFAGIVPVAEVVPYSLRVTADEVEHEEQDGYRFLPTLSELDLHLIGEGRHEQLWTALGSRVHVVAGIRGTTFAVWAPNANGVRVIGDFNGWLGTAHPMRSLGSTGVWELFVPGVAEGTRYKYEIATRDGRMLRKADPMARSAETPPATASIVHTSAYEWQDGEWMAARSGRAHDAPLSVYEVHLPSWRPGLTYRRLATELTEYVSEMGFTHVELMPVTEHPFGASWGYQVSGFYAPTSRLGSPDDFRYLVDALHRAGIGVIMDWVPAHFPKDDWALARFDGEPLYEPSDPRRAEHPDWGTLEFDFGRTEVRNFLVANAVYWCEDFHIDGLRVDAVASMLYLDYSRTGGNWVPNIHGGRENLDAVAFLQEMNATVYRRCPGVMTIAEESTAWPGVTRPTDQDGLGFGLKWNMGWMHDSLEYMQREPAHRRHHHHEMTFSIAYAYSENYVLPISHDEVVHGKRSLVGKMPGDWWQQRANLRAYLAFMWAHPGKKLLFMGQEFAQGTEWDHDTGPQWAVLGDDWPAAADHRGIRELVRDLNSGYRAEPALWSRDTDPSGFDWIDNNAAEDNVFSFVRYDGAGHPQVSISNLSATPRSHYRVGLPARGAWEVVLDTDEVRYGGSGSLAGSTAVAPDGLPWQGHPTSAEITLPPLATIWLRPAAAADQEDGEDREDREAPRPPQA